MQCLGQALRRFTAWEHPWVLSPVLLAVLGREGMQRPGQQGGCSRKSGLPSWVCSMWGCLSGLPKHFPNTLIIVIYMAKSVGARAWERQQQVCSEGSNQREGTALGLCLELRRQDSFGGCKTSQLCQGCAEGIPEAFSAPLGTALAWGAPAELLCLSLVLLLSSALRHWGFLPSTHSLTQLQQHLCTSCAAPVQAEQAHQATGERGTQISLLQPPENH